MNRQENGRYPDPSGQRSKIPRLTDFGSNAMIAGPSHTMRAGSHRLRVGPPMIAGRYSYLTSQSAWLVNYAKRDRAGLRVGTTLTEAAANFLVNQRMTKSQQMRWSRR